MALRLNARVFLVSVKLTWHLAYNYIAAHTALYFFFKFKSWGTFFHNIKSKLTVRVYVNPLWISKELK